MAGGAPSSNPKSFELLHNFFMRYQAMKTYSQKNPEKALHLFIRSFTLPVPLTSNGSRLQYQ